MSVGWDISKLNFINDDGALPTIQINGLSPDGLQGIMAHFLNQTWCSHTNAILYDELEGKELLLDEISDPSTMLILRRISPFHFGCIDANWLSVKIPELGVFAGDDGFDIDYRMGDLWTPSNVEAFFKMIVYMHELAPEISVSMDDVESLPFPELFLRALNHYLVEWGR